MNAAIRILAVGSPFGGDAVTWRAVDALRELPRFGRLCESMPIELSKLDRPGATLLREFDHPGQTIVLDAVADAGAAPGTVSELDIGMLADDDAALSSHGFGVCATLQLAQALGRWPSGLRIVGISIPPASLREGGEAELDAALPSIAAAICALLEASPD